MRILQNTGTDRVLDLIRPELRGGTCLDVVTPTLSLFAFAELLDVLQNLREVRLVLPSADDDFDLLGSSNDRAARNRLQSRWLAAQCASWQKLYKFQRDGAVGAATFKEGIKRVVNNHTSFASSRLRVNQPPPSEQRP